MKAYKAIDTSILRATVHTANISDLGEECAVFLNGHSVGSRCFRCLGSVFRMLPNGTICCDFCKCIYEVK